MREMKADALRAMIDDLRAEISDSSTGTMPESQAVIVIDGHETTLPRDACEIAFHSSDTVRALYEALGCPEDAALTLYDVEVSADVQDTLERLFTAVDEG